MRVSDTLKVWPNEPVVINVGLSGPKFARPMGLMPGTILGRFAMGLREIADSPRGEVVAGSGWDESGTLVVRTRFLAHPALEDSLMKLVERCDQDCIALWYPSLEQGFLFGPHSDEWGEFDKRYFIDAPRLNQ